MSPEEILKPDGSLALAGEGTRIVATPPHSYAMLTIHYDTGNFAIRLCLRAHAALTFSPGARFVRK
jgi:hypothetical protein